MKRTLSNRFRKIEFSSVKTILKLKNSSQIIRLKKTLLWLALSPFSSFKPNGEVFAYAVDKTSVVQILLLKLAV